MRGTQSSSSIPILPSVRRKLLLGVKYVCTGVELKMQLRMTLYVVDKREQWRRKKNQEKNTNCKQVKSYYYELM